MIQKLTEFLNLISLHFKEAMLIIAILWAIHIGNFFLHYKLNVLGIFPRKFPSLLTGPICGPLLHANTDHLFYKCVPLTVMLAILFTSGPVNALCTLVTFSISSGILTWLLARPGCHIGSSGVVVGLIGYFLYTGYQNPSITSVLIGFLLLYYFGTLLFSIFPEDMKTSFEGHFFGLISGILAAHFGCPQAAEYLAIIVKNTLY